MAEIQPPLALQSTDPGDPVEHPATIMRGFMDSLMDFRGGIVLPDDLEVTENGTPNMTVDVATGSAFVRGTTDPDQGMYWVRNEGTTNVALEDADDDDPRIDLVVARVYDDAHDSSGDLEWVLEAVEGNPDPAPVPPAAPDSTLVLARVAVAAQASAITDNDITDRRTGEPGQAQAAALGGIIRCRDTNKPGPDAGRLIFNTDTGLLEVGDGSQFNGLESHSNPIYAIVQRNADLSIPHDTWTAVSWDAAVENPFNLWAASPTPTRVTVTQSGLYQVSVDAIFAANSSGNRGVRLRLNGSMPRSHVLVRAAGSADPTAIQLTRRVRMSPGDYIVVEVFQDTGGPLDLEPADSDQPRFEIKIDRP